MKKVLLATLALSSLAATGWAGTGPVITEKSKQTFTVSLNGLALKLPIELKDHVRVTKAANGSEVLNLNTAIDFSLTVNDPKASRDTVTTGWGDMEIIASECNAKDALYAHVNSLGRLRRLESKVVSIKNSGFKGYILETHSLSGGDLDYVDLKLIDETQTRCFDFNLTAQDFSPFNEAGVKASLAPLTNAIKVSFTTYAEGNAP